MTPYYSEPGIDLYLGDNREVLTELGVLPGDVDLLWGDPPYGMGLEAAAAKRLGLRFIGIELVPEYLDACIARLRQEVLPL